MIVLDCLDVQPYYTEICSTSIHYTLPKNKKAKVAPAPAKRIHSFYLIEPGFIGLLQSIAQITEPSKSRPDEWG